ncbi:hypothetical protein [Pseudooceanicola nanhaiensis]|uniref:hypothetical protein n=1 Tax=Pseudooceanicola nanhaiensis TaxID=375761 RepID=UPI00351492F6
MRLRLTTLGAATAGALGLWAGTAPAQSPGGLQAGLTVGAGAFYDDGALKARSDLGFTLTSATPVQSLGFTARGGLEYPGADDAPDLTDPSVQLIYSRIGANAALEAAAGYKRSEIGTLEPDETGESAELLAGTGIRNAFDVASRLTFGTRAPFGGNVGASWRRVAYSDTGAATLYDFDTYGADGTLRFSIDPRIDLRLTAAWEETDSDGPGRDRRTWSLGAGADVILDRTLTATADLRYTEIETTEAGITTTQTGPGIDLGLAKVVKDGEYRLVLSSLVTTNGDRQILRLRRAQELKLGALSWTAGITRGGDDEVDALLGLEYRRPTRLGELTFAAYRDIQADSFGEEALVDQVRFGYRRALSALNSIEASAAYRRTDYFDIAADSVEQVSLGVTYRHQLTREADLVANYARTLRRSGSIDETEESFYLGFQRNFSWRP